MESSLARDLSTAEAKVQYDENIKNILSNKEILAWILKNTTIEFSDLNIEEIIECIEGDPEISTINTNPSRTKTEYNIKKESTQKITGMKNEDKVPNEGSIYFDIRFYAYAPKEGKRVKIILNLEAQKDFYPGYQIVTRGVFYGGRMISAQLNTEFEIPDYDGLKKVYSIWICMNAPQKIGNAISWYSLEKYDYVSGIPDNREAYDKLSVVMVCLNEKMDKKIPFLAMLNTLLSETKSLEDKMRELEERFHISMKSKLKKELNVMCNLSDLVEERGIEKGIERTLEAMVGMFRELGLSIEEVSEQIAVKLGKPTEEVRKLAEQFWGV